MKTPNNKQKDELANLTEQLQQEIAQRERAEKALRESENKYSGILNITSEGIFHTTPEGKVLSCNPAMAEILGYDSPEDVIRGIKNLADDLYVHSERRKEFLDLIGKQGFVRDFEFKAYRKDRTIIDAIINTHIIRDEDNTLRYFEGVLKDVTEQKKYREHVEELIRTCKTELTGTNDTVKSMSSFDDMRTSLDSYVRELNLRNNALQVINMIADRLYQSLDLPTIAKEAVESISYYSNSPRAVIFEYDEKKEVFNLLYARGFSEHTVKVGTTLPLEGSFTGVAVKRKQILTTMDIARDETVVPAVRKALVGENLIKIVSIPLLFQDKVMGAMNLMFSEQDRGDFQEYERETLFALGKTIGLAMANAKHIDQIRKEIAERRKAEESLQQTNASLTTINMISDAVYKSTDFDTVIAQAANAIDNYFKAPSVSIFLINKEENCLEMIYTSAPDSKAANLTRKLPLRGSLTAYTIATRGVIFSEDVVNDQRVRADVRKAVFDFGWKSCLSLPLFFQDEVMGAMNLFFRENRSFTASELETFLSIGKTIGLALANARHVSQIKAEIIERKKTEEEIRKLNEDLEKRVQERTKELESFSYSVSHDLRSPLRSIDGFTYILMEDYAPELSPDALRNLQLVRTNVKRMAKLIEDLLQFSRMGRQAMDIQEVDPKTIIQEALGDLQRMQEGRQVKITINELPACPADPALLKVVFVNLLSNALKYTSKKDLAQIEIGCLNRNGENIYYVRDNGAGFDMKYVHKMFGVFQRLHSDDEFEGTGCGAAIIQRIINRHGGRVWVEAELDKGATFYFTLGKKEN